MSYSRIIQGSLYTVLYSFSWLITVQSIKLSMARLNPFWSFPWFVLVSLDTTIVWQVDMHLHHHTAQWCIGQLELQTFTFLATPNEHFIFFKPLTWWSSGWGCVLLSRSRPLVRNPTRYQQILILCSDSMWYPLMLGEPSTSNLRQFWGSKQNDTSNTVPRVCVNWQHFYCCFGYMAFNFKNDDDEKLMQNICNILHFFQWSEHHVL